MELIKDIIKFATFGVTVEVLFTAATQVVEAIKNKRSIDLNLTGHSYIWMLPIYGSIAVFARYLFPLVSDYSLILRAFIYGVVILIVEYICGFLIKLITGKCPWHYTSKWSIHGFIRLDYLPLWMVFGIAAEAYFNF